MGTRNNRPMNQSCGALFAAIMMLGGCAATEHAAAPEHRPAEPPAAGDSDHAGDMYYFDTCAACGGLLGTRGETFDVVIAGRDLRFCSAGCRNEFERDPAAGLKRLDGIMIADQLPHYPLTTSIVSGRALGESPVGFIWGNRLFRVADAAEKDAVLADPGGYIAALDRAVVAAQAPTYGMPTKCPVQGDILASDVPSDIVVANRMIRVCCARCVRVVRARPSQYLSMVDYANRAAAERRAREEGAGG